jgi:hypothetical protein
LLPTLRPYGTMRAHSCGMHIEQIFDQQHGLGCRNANMFRRNIGWVAQKLVTPKHSYVSTKKKYNFKSLGYQFFTLRDDCVSGTPDRYKRILPPALFLIMILQPTYSILNNGAILWNNVSLIRTTFLKSSTDKYGPDRFRYAVIARATASSTFNLRRRS